MGISDSVTLITRPGRFGKTLNMSMIQHFLSVDYADKGDLFYKYDFLLESGHLNENECASYRQVSANMEDYMAASSLRALSDYLSRYYGKKQLYCWMSMMLPCRRPTCSDTGRR